MKSRNKNITLDILTGMSATESGRKYNLTHQTAGRIVNKVIKEAIAKSIHAIPDHASTITGYKAISTSLIPIVHNHYEANNA